MVEHTEQAFKLDTEGRRRRTAGEDYRERSRESGKQVVETVAGMLPGVGTAMTAEEIREELQREDPNYRKIALLGGAELIGLIPGLGTTAKAGLKKIIDTPFKKTRKAYKLFVKKDDKLYPLFVNAADEVPQGRFLEADFPDTAFKGKTVGGTEGFYVPTKGAKREPTRYYDADGLEITKKEYNSLGSNQKEFARMVKGEEAKKTGDTIIIPDEETRKKLIETGFITKRTGRTKDAPYGKVTAVAARPGWHSSVNPVAEHLGPQDLKITKVEAKKIIKAGVNPKAIRTRGDQYYVKRRAEDHVWAEVDMADDTSDELLNYMAQKGRTDINDKVPVGGSYSYVDGQADGDAWIVGGNMRVNRTLSREEAKELQDKLGIKDLPYRDEIESILGRKFNQGGLVGDIMYTGGEDYKTTSSFGIDETKMNKGGMSPNRQMEMAFMQQGGLKDDGMKVDPVSGNEIPPGSMAKEVRDDIPAQLSEGEYVVPADVVQYYGVKHFEDLRNKAKGGLNQMEADGRIGGEPISKNASQMQKPVETIQASPYTQTPSQMAMDSALTGDELQEIQKMVEGGMVQPMMANPYEQQRTMYKQPQQMNVGGPVVNTPPAPTQGYSASPFIPGIGTGFSFERPTQPAPVEVPQTQVTLYGPNGETVVLMLPKQQAEYDQLLSQGYSLTAPTPTTQPARDRDDDGGGRPPPPTAKSWYETTDFTSGKEGGKASAEGYFGKPADFGAGLVGLAGAAIGGIPGAVAGRYGVQVSNLASARAEVIIRTAMGDEDGAKALQAAINAELKASSGLGLADKAIDAIFGSDGDMKVIDALVAAGIEVDRGLRGTELDNFMEDLRKNKSLVTKLQNKFGDKTKKPVTPVTDKVDSSRTFRTSDKDTRSETVALKARIDDDRESFTEKIQKQAKAIADKAADTGKSIAEVGREKAPSSAAKSPTQKAADEGDPRAGMYNKGGLMQKKKKK